MKLFPNHGCLLQETSGTSQSPASSFRQGDPIALARSGSLREDSPRRAASMQQLRKLLVFMQVSANSSEQQTEKPAPALVMQSSV